MGLWNMTRKQREQGTPQDPMWQEEERRRLRVVYEAWVRATKSKMDFEDWCILRGENLITPIEQ